MIEFRPDGTIVGANRVFLDLMGYSLQEVVGRHHALFVDPSTVVAAPDGSVLRRSTLPAERSTSRRARRK